METFTPPAVVHRRDEPKMKNDIKVKLAEACHFLNASFHPANAMPLSKESGATTALR